PMIAATLSLTRSFLAFSAKVGQSLAPSSWMNLILRPRMPPAALICPMASFSASIEPVSEMAIVPVAECRMPQVTSVSVTARPVVLIAEVAGACANDGRGSMVKAGIAAIPISSLRRNADCSPCLLSSDIFTPFVFEDALLAGQGSPRLCSAQIRKIAYTAPQNSDVGFRRDFENAVRLRSGVHSGRAAAHRPRQAPI